MSCGYQVVIFTSSGQFKAWDQVAPNCPDTIFAMLSTTTKLPDSKNVVAYEPDFFAYGVINGLIGAESTKTNKIAGIAGVPVKAVEDMFSAQSDLAIRRAALLSGAGKSSALPVSRSLKSALPQFVWRNGSILARSNSGPARPYMARLRVFQAVDLTFRLAVAPRHLDGVFDRIEVPVQGAGEAHGGR